MERRFALLKNVFVSVAGGVQKRRQANQKGRRNSRLSLFDKARNLPRSESPAPAPLSEAEQKVEQRRKQLEKWKEEKEKRKKELASQKKKPFLVGVAPNSLRLGPPPPLKVLPSTSGMVTRSQAAKNNAPEQKVKKAAKVETKPVKSSKSFAPKNASFHPPEIKGLLRVPTLNPVAKTRKHMNYTFNFNIDVNVAKEKSAKPMETRMITRKAAKELEKATNNKFTKKSSEQSSDSVGPVKSYLRKSRPKIVLTTSNLSSSSSSDMEITAATKNSTKKNFVTVKKSTRKSISKATVFQSSTSDLESSAAEKSPILKINTPLRSHDTYVLTPGNPVAKSESNSEQKLRSPVTPQEVVDNSKKISPFVTLSRGKSNARREMMQKLAEGLLDEDNSNAESVEHFRRQLASEVARLNQLCDTWDELRAGLAEPVLDEVLGAVGQARLLISSKLQQFAGLVERCARPEPGSPLITPADLSGFWDMVFIQIVNVDMRFKNLSERRARNWVDEPQPVKRVAAKKVVRPNAGTRPTTGTRPATGTRPTAGPSRLKEMIAAARKAMKEQEVQPEKSHDTETENKTFEAGFFCVHSPVRSPVHSAERATPRQRNLLQAVLSSEAKKASASKSASSFAMLRASILSRNLEYEGIAPLPQTPLPQINMDATPGRSILKSANKSSVKSGKKSVKVVLFSDSDSDTQVTPVKYSEENKENVSISKSRVVRQDAIDTPGVVTDNSGVVTRSRKSMKTPETEEKVEKTVQTRRSSRRKTLQENDNSEVVPTKEVVPTPKRSTRRRKGNVQVKD